MPLVKELHSAPLYAVDELMIRSRMRNFVIALLRLDNPLVKAPFAACWSFRRPADTI